MRQLPCCWKLPQAVRTTDASSVRFTQTCLFGSECHRWRSSRKTWRRSKAISPMRGASSGRGANPFAMSYENLKLRALTVRDYLIKCQTMAMFASIRDIRDKEVWQLKKLRAMGINGLTIGTESGDRILFRLHDRACGEGQGILECGEQCRAVQPAQSIFYFRGFPHAVPGYGTVPHGTGGEIYPCRGKGTHGGTAGVHQKSADKDTPVCQFWFEFLPGRCLSAEGTGACGKRAAARYGYGKRE